METPKTAKQIRSTRKVVNNKTQSYNVQQKQYAKSQGKFKDDAEGRDKKYSTDIEYIQSIVSSEMSKEWTERLEEVLAQHNSDAKNTIRIKSKAIKTVFEFKKHRRKHDDALKKMLNALG
jgi:hypothetical protein